MVYLSWNFATGGTPLSSPDALAVRERNRFMRGGAASAPLSRASPASCGHDRGPGRPDPVQYRRDLLRGRRERSGAPARCTASDGAPGRQAGPGTRHPAAAGVVYGRGRECRPVRRTLRVRQLPARRHGERHAMVFRGYPVSVHTTSSSTRMACLRALLAWLPDASLPSGLRMPPCRLCKLRRAWRRPILTTIRPVPCQSTSCRDGGSRRDGMRAGARPAPKATSVFQTIRGGRPPRHR